MNQTNRIGKYSQFFAGMLAMLILTSVVVSASAVSEKVSFNQVGIRVLRQQKVQVGERYTAPNGQQVPSSITYTDAAGGQTNYLSARQISELLDADISWNSKLHSVDIGVLSGQSDVTITSSADGIESGITADAVPEYGKTIGALTEVSPDSVQGLMNGTAVPSRSYAYSTHIQYGLGGSFPEMTVTAKPSLGKYLVYTVSNNGETAQEVTVSRKVTISTGRRELFPSVPVEPGETLVRVFGIAKDADPMQSAFAFGVVGTPDREHETDVTVSLMVYS